MNDMPITMALHHISPSVYDQRKGTMALYEARWSSEPNEHGTITTYEYFVRIVWYNQKIELEYDTGWYLTTHDNYHAARHYHIDYIVLYDDVETEQEARDYVDSLPSLDGRVVTVAEPDHNMKTPLEHGDIREVLPYSTSHDPEGEIAMFTIYPPIGTRITE